MYHNRGGGREDRGFWGVGVLMALAVVVSFAFWAGLLILAYVLISRLLS